MTSRPIRRSFVKTLSSQRYLLILVLPAVIWMLVFCYYPLYGLVIAFKDYNIGKGIFGSPWCGMKNFVELFHDTSFLKSIRNTLMFNVLDLVFRMPFPIFFALLINELRGCNLFKRVTQTMSYLPHFLSWAFVASFLLSFTGDKGVLNTTLQLLGIIDEPKAFMSIVPSFISIMVIASIWKSFGYSSIIYLAAMTSIDVQIYEAADIDGAGRFERIWYITLPSIKSVVVIMLILALGSIFNTGFEQFYLLQNSFVADYAKVMDVYTYEVGMMKARFSYATAVGMFKSVVSMVLIFIANWVSNMLTGDGIL